MSRKYFEETQQFRSPVLIISMGLIYISVLVIFSYGFYMQFVLVIPFGEKPMSNLGLLLVGMLVVAVLTISGGLLFGSKLRVDITKKGIFYQFWPFHKKERIITPDQIVSFEVRTYKPIVEYGGWGVRLGSSKTGDACNVSGKVGLQLVLKNNKRLLLGTQRPEAIAHAMKKMLGGEK